MSCTQQQKPTNYYFNAKTGNDANAGTSSKEAFQSLEQLKSLQLKHGDSIFLASGVEFKEPLELIEVFGSQSLPIVVSSYPKNSTEKAFIKTKGHLNAVLIENSSFIEIHNLDLSAQSDVENEVQDGEMRCGVLVQATKPGDYQHIYLSHLDIHDIFYEDGGFTRPKGEVKTANGTQAYGWGIRFINNTEGAELSDLKVEHSRVKNVSHTGIKLTSRLKGGVHGIKNFQVNDNQVFQTGGPGIQMSGVFNGHIFNNTVDQSGSTNDSRKWGRGSGLWTWGSSDILIEHNRFTNANGPGDSAGAHIDFNCKNVVLQYNFSANNAGGFCEILGNNYNCAYRYNISVNDGHRVKGENGAFQEGKIFWLSGYAGNNSPQKGPFNSYFYNNTIYVGKDIIPKIAIHRKAKGVLIANNIFHFENSAEIVKGDQYNPESAGDWQVEDVVFKNNLFLNESTWPKELLIQDEAPTFGNANFSNLNGLSLADYLPQNQYLIKDKGIPISKIPMDSIGLIYGLELEKDILGNTIQGMPDLGAIEIK
jgi:hypothetical protein